MGRNVGQLKYEAVNNFDMLADPSISAPTYIGWAAVGSATSASVWQICKLTATKLYYPDQSIPTGKTADDFVFVWDDRVSYFA